MNNDLISWIKDCRDILYPLSSRENDSLGIKAEGLGQASVALLEKLENVSPVFKDEPFTEEFKRSASFSWEKARELANDIHTACMPPFAGSTYNNAHLYELAVEYVGSNPVLAAALLLELAESDGLLLKDK